MQTSVLIARLIGPVMLVVGIAVFINGRAFRSMAEDFMANHALMFLSGLLTMLGGVAIVVTHNVWTADWRGLITLLGWLTAIGGAIRLIAPEFVVQAGRAIMRQSYMPVAAGAIWFVIGLVFCFFGYR
jgi:hypothetical protein